MSETAQKIKSRLPETVPFYRTPVTVQILLLRQTHDYAVFRTEETRELNIAVTPASISDSDTGDACGVSCVKAKGTRK